MQLNRLG